MKKVLIVALLTLLIPVIAIAGSQEWLSSTVELTPSGTFVDIGAEIETKRADGLGLMATVGTGNCSEVKVRAMGKHTSAGTGEYPIVLDTINNLTITGADTYYEYSVTSGNVTEYKSVYIPLERTFPYLQIQMASDFPSGKNATVSSVVITQKRR